jgi:hypothetical protein
MRTRTILLILAALAGISLLVAGCADRRDPTESAIQAHPADWNTPGAEDFHGVYVAQRGDVESCSACHGEGLDGQSKAPGCSDCHAGPSGHPEGYVRTHPLDVAAEGNGRCADCHGEDYRGGWAEVSCYTCHGGGPSGHPAPAQWFNPSSARFHGAAVAETGPGRCATCHGQDYMGGVSGVSCFTCHAGGPSGHPEGWVPPSGANFHGAVVEENGPQGCRDCHGDDYRGGTSGRSCFTCHEGGPGGHPALSEWYTPTSTEFHGLVACENGFDDCARCHELDGTGGTSGLGCGNCHPGGLDEGVICGN